MIIISKDECDEILKAASDAKNLQENLITIFEIVRSNKKDFFSKLESFNRSIKTIKGSRSDPLVRCLIKCIKDIHLNAGYNQKILEKIISEFENEIQKSNQYLDNEIKDLCKIDKEMIRLDQQLKSSTEIIKEINRSIENISCKLSNQEKIELKIAENDNTNKQSNLNNHSLYSNIMKNYNNEQESLLSVLLGKKTENKTEQKHFSENVSNLIFLKKELALKENDLKKHSEEMTKNKQESEKLLHYIRNKVDLIQNNIIEIILKFLDNFFKLQRYHYEEKLCEYRIYAEKLNEKAKTDKKFNKK